MAVVPPIGEFLLVFIVCTPQLILICCIDAIDPLSLAFVNSTVLRERNLLIQSWCLESFSDSGALTLLHIVSQQPAPLIPS